MKPEPVKILIVDDVPANIVALSQVLRPLDVQVLSANSGAEAIGLLLRHKGIALILMDVQMPEMDGFETAELIRQDDDSCTIPIIFVTAISTEEKYIFKGYQTGAVDYLFKPVDGDVLVSKVRVFVELFEQQRQTLRALEEVKRIENSRTLLLDNAYEGIIGVDNKLTINFVNASALTQLHYDKSELTGLSFKHIAAPNMSYSDWNNCPIVNTIKTESRLHKDDWQFTDKTGREFPVEFTQVSIVEDGKIIGSVILFRDITERMETQRKLIKLAQNDALTGLANRSMFWNLLGKSIANSKRHKTAFALLYIDLDRFKQVNDSLGHLAGDLLLTKASERIQACLREEDFVARLGGDEFSVIATYVDSPQVAAELANRINRTLEQPFDIFDQEASIGASIGIALFPEHGEEIKSLTGNADVAMYAAKKKGRNNFQFFNEDMQVTAEQHLAQSREVAAAIEAQAIVPLYQTLYTGQALTNPSNRDISFLGVSATIHWPQRSDVNAEFIARNTESLKKSSFLNKSLLTQIEAAIKQTVTSNEEQMTVVIDLNISPYQIQSKYLSTKLSPILERLEIQANNIVIEVSESVLISNPAIAVCELQMLASEGYRICLKDFALDQTRASILLDLPLFALKTSTLHWKNCDKEKTQRGLALFASIARSLNTKFMVTDVNTERDAQLIANTHIDIVQGNYFSSATENLSNAESPSRANKATR